MGVGFFSIDILRMYRVYRENTKKFSSIQYILMRTLKKNDNFVKKGFFKIEFVIMSYMFFDTFWSIWWSSGGDVMFLDVAENQADTS